MSVLFEVFTNQGRDLEDAQVAEIWRTAKKATKQPFADFHQLAQVRLRWLAARVVAGTPPWNRSLRAYAMSYQLPPSALVLGVEWDKEMMDAQEADRKEEEKTRRHLVAEIETLAQQIGPGPPGALTKGWHRVEQRRKGRQRQQDLTRAADEESST
jgi:hypothetical protein